MSYRSLVRDFNYWNNKKEKMETTTERVTHLEDKAIDIAKNYSDFKGGYKDFQKDLLKFAEEYHEYKVSNFIL